MMRRISAGFNLQAGQQFLRPRVSLPRYAGHVHAIKRSLAVSAVLLFGTACLSKNHVIPRSELQQLAQTDGKVRGQKVRVIQGFMGSAEPPPAPVVDTGPRVGVVVVTPSPPAPVPAVHGSSAIAGKLAKQEAKSLLVLAAAVAIGAAFTEGMRYDGWVQLHPMHPVHLYGWDGSYRWLPLAQITPEVAAGTRRAIVRDGEGPWKRTGRAPLNRRGWTYSLLMGSAETPLLDGTEARGFASHLQIGRFFTRNLGMMLDFGIGWADDDFGDTIYESRNALELQFLPVAASILHAGVFGQIGVGYRLDDGYVGGDRRGFVAGAGVLAQLELTTRLAITARAGQTMAYGTRTSDFTVGLSIY